MIFDDVMTITIACTSITVVYPPEEPEEFRVILSDFDKCIMPGTRHWVHPANYANFPCGNSLINIPADMLSVAMGGVTFSWVRNMRLLIVAH